MKNFELDALCSVGEALQALAQHRILAVREMTDSERVEAMIEEIRSIVVLSNAVSPSERHEIEQALDNLEHVACLCLQEPAPVPPAGLGDFQP
jgi:predicted AAA+ superfamily ATPase